MIKRYFFTVFLIKSHERGNQVPPNKLRELEEKYGDLNEVIPKLVSELGQRRAAKKLDVSQSLISIWLNTNHYEVFSEYRKVTARRETQP